MGDSEQDPDIPEDGNHHTVPVKNGDGQQDTDITEDGNHHPVPAKKKMPKRKRVLSTKLHSKNNQKVSKFVPSGENVMSTNAEGSGALVCQSVQSRAATSYVTNAVLKTNLKSTLSKLSSANGTIVDQDKKLSALYNKTKDLTETVRRSRAATKEARSATLAAARDADTKVKNVQDTAAASIQQAEVKLKKLQATIDQKEAALHTHKQQYDDQLESAVRTAVEKEKERSARALSVAERKFASKLSKTVKDHAMEIESKNKEIKNLKAMCEAKNNVACELRVENTKIRHEMEDTILSKDIKKREKVSTVTKRAMEQVNSLKQVIAKKDKDISEISNMAIDVATEYNQLDKERKAQARETTKQVEHHKKLAASRLEKMMQSQLEATDLQVCIESIKDKHDDELAEAKSKIASLTRELRTNKEEVESLECDLAEAIETIDKLTPHIIKKKGKHMEWDSTVTQLIMEQLANRTPPSCICPNILSTLEIIIPKTQIMVESPSIRFVRYCRTVAVWCTKTIAAYEVALADDIIQAFFDGTSRRQTEFNNFVAKIKDIYRPGHFRKVTLDGCIIAEDGSAESTARAFKACFKQGGDHLNYLRQVFTEIYPDDHDILSTIPTGDRLSIAKLAGAFKTSDGCSTAVKLRRDLETLVREEVANLGLPANTVKSRMADCWRHMPNVWFDAINGDICGFITDYVQEDLKNIPTVYRVQIDSVDTIRGVEKLAGTTANYPKGHGDELEWWMIEYHPGAILFPTTRACGGARQDLCVEGAPAVLMNLQYYLEFLHWRLTAVGGKSDAILATKLFIMLRSSEVVAQFRVLSILYVSVCLPVRWLAGKCHELAEFNFGYYDMSTILTCLEQAFEAILDDPSLFLDEEFMMERMFEPITSKIPPLREYLEHIFEIKSAMNVNNQRVDAVLLDMLRAALFYPTRDDIIQTNNFCLELAVVISTRLLQELRDESKVTHHYLESMNGIYSVSVVSEEERKAAMGIEASNNISESVHGMSTRNMQQFGTIRFDSCAAGGQQNSNGDWNRDHAALIRRRKQYDENGNEIIVERDLGFFHRLNPKIQNAIIVAGRRKMKETQKSHDDAIKHCRQAKLNRMKLAQQKNAEAKGEAYIEAMDYIEQYHSGRCWKTPEQAREEFEILDSESKRLRAVKEQISIRRKGFGWEDVGHNWSKNGYTFTSKELFDHFVSVVLEAECNRDIPSEPNISLSIDKYQHKLGTMTALKVDERFNAKSGEEFKQEMVEERERREVERETDRAAMLQRNVMPNFGNELIGFKIEYCFTYLDEEDGSSYPAWCDGVIESIVSERLRTVMIRWNAEKVADGDLLVSKHPLMKSCWNPKKPKQNAWREYIDGLDS